MATHVLTIQIDRARHLNCVQPGGNLIRKMEVRCRNSFDNCYRTILSEPLVILIYLYIFDSNTQSSLVKAGRNSTYAQT